MRVGMWVYNENTHILCKFRGIPGEHTHDVMGVGTLWLRTYRIIIIYIMFYCRVGNSFGRRLSKKKCRACGAVTF